MQPIEAPVLGCDNMGAGSIASNPISHARTKHIQIDVHFLRDKAVQYKSKVRYVPNSEQTANILTKMLPSSCFLYLRSKLNLKSSPFSLKGVIYKNVKYCNTYLSYILCVYIEFLDNGYHQLYTRLVKPISTIVNLNYFIYLVNLNTELLAHISLC